LNFYTWEGYDLPDATKSWLESNDVQLKAGYIATNEDMPTKVLSEGGAGIDVITYAQYFSELDRGLKVVTDIQPEEVTELSQFYDAFRTGTNWLTPEGNYTGIPFSWGSSPLTYNPDVVPAVPTSWMDLLQPEFKGRIAFMDDPVGGITTAAQILGFSDIGNQSPSQLEEVKGLLLKMKSQAKVVASTYGDLTNLFDSGEIVASFVGWSALSVFATQAKLVGAYPNEGVVLYCDAFAIPPTTDNRATAIGWINLVSTKEVQAAAADYLAGGVVRPDAVPLIGSKLIREQLYPYDSIEPLFTSSFGYSIATESTDQIVSYDDWLTMWESVKAA
jgi:spermidine/putrescine-binding protein